MQVQNISQSMEVLDLRTYRDLQYVRNTESLMKGLDSRLKVAAESQKSLNAKSFQVSPCPLPTPRCLSRPVGLAAGFGRPPRAHGAVRCYEVGGHPGKGPDFRDLGGRASPRWSQG